MSRHGLPIKQHTHVGINQGGDLVFPAPPAPPPPPGCGHKHITETFTATGGVDTFTLAFAPLWDRRVYVSGARVTPAAVTGTGRSVIVDTSDLVVGSYDTIIDYEAACSAKLPVPPPSSGTALAFPGANETHGDYTNTLATFVTTGPAFVTLDLTAVGPLFGALLTDVVDPSGVSSSGTLGTDGFDEGFTPAIGMFYAAIPSAGTWHVVTNAFNPYDATVTDGVGTLAVTYPTTPTGSLAFPGVSDGTFQNRLGLFSGGAAVVFLTIGSAMPTGFYLGVSSPGFGDDHNVGPASPAGTYVFRLATSDTWTMYGYSTGTYNAGLTNTGSYEVMPL